MVLLHLRELERAGGAALDLHGAPVAGRPQAELLAWYLEQQDARRAAITNTHIRPQTLWIRLGNSSNCGARACKTANPPGSLL